MLTGNLSASVDSSPPFPGVEKHLLRAQLARIQHSTEIVPAGLYEADEETGIKVVEEIPAFTTDKLKGADGWVHLPRGLLNCGRTTALPAPEDLDEEAATAWLEDQAAKDPIPAPLAALTEDKPVEGRDGSWVFKTVGDLQPYKPAGEGENVSYAVNVVESVRWPGSVTVAKNGEWC